MYCCDVLHASVLLVYAWKLPHITRQQHWKVLQEQQDVSPKFPGKVCVAVLMMLIYQHNLNIVPGPDTNNFSCLRVQSASWSYHSSRASCIVNLLCPDSCRCCHAHTEAFVWHPRVIGVTWLMISTCYRTAFTMTRFGPSHCCGAHGTAQLS